MSATEIFGKNADIYTQYLVELKFRNLVVGGVPSDESVIRNWIKAKMNLKDEAIEELVAQTKAERGDDLPPDQIVDAIMESDIAPNVNGFKRSDNGELFIEGRQVKALLKEASNSAYPGVDYPGKAAAAKAGFAGARKGLRSTLEEAVFVVEDQIGLGVKEPTRVEERVKHVKTPQGPRSNISRVEVVEQASIAFIVKVRSDFLPDEAWGRIWAVAEEIGLGADRGRSDGRFDLLTWDRM